MDNTAKNGKIVDDGDIFWFKDDLLHREDGPAVEWPDGTKEWYLNGKRHRGNGPAVEYADGDREWWLDGMEYNKSHYEWMTSTKKSNLIWITSDIGEKPINTNKVKIIK